MKGEVAVNGVLANASLLATFGGTGIASGAPGIGGAFDAQLAASKRVNAGSLDGMASLLTVQATSLNAVYTHYARQAAKAEYLDQAERYMRLALRAQNQSRMTIETLALVKNPPHATFIRQANVANGHQQINNAPAQAQPNPERNELSRQTTGELGHEQPLVIGAAGATAAGDQAMATVGAIHGATHGRRQGASRSKRR